jgi:SAM-dependent methyltransferase
VFTETVTDGVNGFRCQTLGDALAALERIEEGGLSWQKIHDMTRDRFDMRKVAFQYDQVFQQLDDLRGRGYYSHRSRFGPVVRARYVPAPQPAPAEPLEPAPTPFDPAAQTWEDAQAWEHAWWMDPTHRAARWKREQEKQGVYAQLMDLPDSMRFNKKSLLDLGCGPVSLLFRTKTSGKRVAVDPLDFEDAKHYAQAGIERIYQKAEAVKLQRTFHEVWIYNVLQHVEDVAAVLAQAKKYTKQGGCIRLFEWLNVGQCEGHLQNLTVDLFGKAFPKRKWRRDKWEEGQLKGPQWEMTPGDYLAAVVVKR